MKKFAFQFERKSLVEAGERRGEFTGRASVFGNVDDAGDVVMPGAFSKWIARTGGKVPILWQHDVKRPIGIGQVVETASALEVSGRLSLGTRDGMEAYELMRDGVLTGLSIGYMPVQGERIKGGEGRRLTEIDLFEISAVTFPANALATISTVKAAGRDGLEPFRALVRDTRELARRMDGERRERAAVIALSADRALIRKAGRIVARLGKFGR